MATYRAPKVVLPIFNPLVYPVEESAGETLTLTLVGYTFTALYEYAQPNPNTDLITGKWSTITSSADCSVLYIPEGNFDDDTDTGYVYLTDSGSPPTDGSAFVTYGAFLNYLGVACSADGTRGVTSGMTGANNAIRQIRWTSNSGVTWNLYSPLQKFFTDFACSSSGLIMYGATNTDYIYKSTDGGSSWVSLTNAGISNWSGVTCSDNGSIVYGCPGKIFNPTVSRSVYKSTDGGSSWTELTSSPLQIYSSISCDSTGQIVIAGARSLVASVFVSTNGGSSWTTTSLTGDFFAVKCSPDGTKLFAGNNGALFYSLDLGVTWTNAGLVKNWTGVTCNTDGTIVYAVDNSNPTGGNVWRGDPLYVTS